MPFGIEQAQRVAFGRADDECGQAARVGRQNLRLRERGSAESGVRARVDGCFESFFARSGDCVGNGENRQCLFQAFV